MADFDVVDNAIYAMVLTAPSPAASGTSLVLQTGWPQFPQPGASGGYNVTLYPPRTGALPSNMEIVRVTAVSGTTLTITRAQEGTSAKTVEGSADTDPETTTAWQVAFAPTAKTMDDIFDAINAIAPGVGTVTSVSVATANGVSGTVDDPTTTPEITLTLGNITPTSVAASGNVTGSNLSGTNTGDQTITLTGDVTGTGTGTFAATLATVNSNVGSFGSATAAGTFTVNAKGLVTAAASTTVTPAVGSITGLGTGVATALAVNVGSAGAPVVQNGAGGTPSSLTLTNATGLPTAGLVDDAVTYAKMQDVSAASRLIGRGSAGGSGSPEEISLGSGLSMTGTTLSATASGGGTKTYAVLTPLDNQPPASNYATFDTRNSIAVLDFDDTTEESAIFVRILPEAADVSSGLKVIIKWMATTATSGNCRLGCAFMALDATTDADSDSFDTAAEATTAAEGTSGETATTEITITTIDSITAGMSYRLKIYRDTSDGADTMAGDAEVHSVEVRSAA